jgi:hypothetical protein
MRLALLIGLCVFTLLGCGGSGGKPPKPQGTTVRLSVKWPQPSRIIHQRSDRVSVIVSAGGIELSVVNLDKDPTVPVTSVELAVNAPTGLVEFDIRAYERANPGEVLSSARVTRVLTPGVNELGFTLESSVDRVALEFSSVRFAVGETVSYSVLGYAGDRIVLDRPTDFDLTFTGDAGAVQHNAAASTLTGLRDGRLFAQAREAGTGGGQWTEPIELRVGNGIGGGAFYTAEAVAIPGAAQTVFRGTNSQGDTAGFYSGGGPGGKGGFVRRSDGSILILTPPQTSLTGTAPQVTSASGIDDTGNVVGTVAEGGNSFVAVWSDYGQTLRYYGRMGSGVNGNEALAMNARGDILLRWSDPFQGFGTRLVQADSAYAYLASSLIDGNGMGLSDDGTVLSAVPGGGGASYYATPFGGAAQAVQLPAQGSVRAITRSSALLGVSPSGVVLYWATWSGSPQELAWHGDPADVSNAGLVVGWSQELGLWGFVGEVGGQVVSLDDRITGMPPGVNTLSPLRILEDGRIFATGFSTSGNEASGVILSPVP